jgi:hypothetical protein
VFAWRAYKRLIEQAAEREERFLVIFDRIERTLQRNNDVIERNSTALADMRDEVRANTQAIVRLLDRLDGGEQPA